MLSEYGRESKNKVKSKSKRGEGGKEKREIRAGVLQHVRPPSPDRSCPVCAVCVFT